MVENRQHDKNVIADEVEQINAIVDYFSAQTGGLVGRRMEVYGSVTEVLSRIDGGKNWTWKYLRNVERKAIRPGKRFARALDILYGMISGLPSTVSVTPVNGSHAPPNTEVLLIVRICPDDRGKDCGNKPFVVNHPRRIRCFTCSQYKGSSHGR